MVYEVLDFLDDLLIATALIVTTCVIHGFGMDRMMHYILHRHNVTHGGRPRPSHKLFMAVTSILGIFILVTAHIWIWAMTYKVLEIPEFKTLEDAVYFSTVTFTTLGYGDIVLHDQWRVLSGIEAANGIVLLGWSTAFLFEVMTVLYPRRANF
jgi:hypothetical protein